MAARTTSPKTTTPKTPAKSAGKPAPTTMAKAAAAPAAKTTKRAAKAPAVKAPRALKAVPAPTDTGRVSKRFAVADTTDGLFTCRTCGEDKSVKAFPTVAGPDVRGTECRACRDAARSTS